MKPNIVITDHNDNIMDKKSEKDDDILYTSALSALMSSEHQAITKDAILKTSLRRTQTVNDMHIYMQRIGLLNEQYEPITKKDDSDHGTTTSDDDDDDDDGTVSVIHVAGTKGKGSVCAMCEAIMRHHNPKNATIITGLFTSPHLVDIRERIRINGLPISKYIFGLAYWTIRKQLEQYESTTSDELPTLPGYFRMITLLALYIFKHYRTGDDIDDTTKRRRVTCIILEVGMGGRYDATNVQLPWTKPTIVCGITLIDYDHVRILGHTLPAIAWEKGGIYAIKKGHCNDDDTSNNENDKRTPHPIREQEQYMKAIATIPSYGDVASQQRQQQEPKSRRRYPRCFALDTNDDSVIDVFRLCACNEGQGNDLILAGPSHNPQLPKHLPSYELGLKGTHQRDNAELAIALCQTILKEDTHVEMNCNNMLKALSDMTWPGRCQTVMYTHSDMVRGVINQSIPITIRLDGAHTIQSIRAGLEWYNTVTNTAIQDATTATPKSTSSSSCHILVFNCSHERNPVELLDILYHNSKTKFHAVYFCRADSERPSAVTKSSIMELWQASSPNTYKDNVTDTEVLRTILSSSETNDTPTWQDTLLGIWKLLELTSTTLPYKAMDHASNLTCVDAIQRGFDFVHTHAEKFTSIEYFCTGSLYLVGSMLTAIHWQEEEAHGRLITA